MQYPVTARQLADIVEGNHNLPDEPRDKVISLVNLTIAYEAMRSMGWHEHTSDWDWRIIIEAGDTTYGSEFANEGWFDEYTLHSRGSGQVIRPIGSVTCACVDWEWYGSITFNLDHDTDAEPDLIRVFIQEITGISFIQA